MVVTVRGVWHAGLERSNVTRLLRSGAAFVFRLLQCRYRQVSVERRDGLSLTLRTVGPCVASSGLRWQGLRGATLLGSLDSLACDRQP